MESNRIYLGDAYELVKQMPDKSVDLVYSDIPYMILNGGRGAGLLKNKVRNQTYEKTIGKFANGIDWSILDELSRVMKHIYIYMVLEGANSRSYGLLHPPEEMHLRSPGMGKAKLYAVLQQHISTKPRILSPVPGAVEDKSKSYERK